MKDSYALYTNKLKHSYKDTFNKIELYCNTINMPQSIKEEKLMDLVDTFLSAQHARKPVSFIVGDDIEAFCINFAKGSSMRDFFYDFATKIKGICLITLIISLLNILALINEESFFKIKSNVLPFFLGYICGSVALLFIGIIFRKLIFKNKNITSKHLMIFSIVISALLYGGYIYFHTAMSLNIYSWIIVVVSGVLLMAYYIIQHVFFSDKIKKDEKINFSDMVFSEAKKQYIKQFENKNTRLILKGKPMVSEEEFTAKCKKANQQSLNVYKWSWLIFAIIIVIFTIPVITASKLSDTLIFISIMIFFMLLINKLWLNKMLKVEKLKKELFDKCDTQGVSIIEYLKNEKN